MTINGKKRGALTCVMVFAATIATVFAPYCSAQSPVVSGSADVTMALSFKESPIEKQVLDLLSLDKNVEAKKLLRESIKKESADKRNLYYLLALTEFDTGEYDLAAADLKRVLDAPAAGGLNGVRNRVMLLNRIGECYLNLRDIPAALASFKVRPDGG